jgi:hypothetical protein
MSMMTIGTHRKAMNEYPFDTGESACPVTAGDVMDDAKGRKKDIVITRIFSCGNKTMIPFN